MPFSSTLPSPYPRSSATWFRDVQWVRRALTVTPAFSSYLVNDRAGSGSMSLELDSPAAAGPRLLQTGASFKLDGLALGGLEAQDDGPPLYSCSSSGRGVGGAGQEAQQEPPEYRNLDVVFGHGGSRGMRVWLVLRLVSAWGGWAC